MKNFSWVIVGQGSTQPVYYTPDGVLIPHSNIIAEERVEFQTYEQAISACDKANLIFPHMDFKLQENEQEL